MKRLSRPVVPSMAMGLGLLALGFAGCEAEDADARDDDALSPATMVLNVTTDPEQDPHAVTMALQLAGHSLDAGRVTVLFFNVRGVKAATAGLPEDLAFGDLPVKELLGSLMDRGAEVHVCPHCMEAMGITGDDLIPGAQVTDRDRLFAHLTSNTVVFSY